MGLEILLCTDHTCWLSLPWKLVYKNLFFTWVWTPTSSINYVIFYIHCAQGCSSWRAVRIVFVSQIVCQTSLMTIALSQVLENLFAGNLKLWIRKFNYVTDNSLWLHYKQLLQFWLINTWMMLKSLTWCTHMNSHSPIELLSWQWDNSDFLYFVPALFLYSVLFWEAVEVQNIASPRSVSPNPYLYSSIFDFVTLDFSQS